MRALAAAPAATFLSLQLKTMAGEWPLFFAACTNQATMVETLVAAGADLDAHDCNGNTILHLLVYHELPEMYDYVVDLWKHQKGIQDKQSPCVVDVFVDC
jgi:ankyrin repeat protein